MSSSGDTGGNHKHGRNGAGGEEVPPGVLKGDKPGRSKKLRLHWDEDNLRSNELEIERNPPRMRIDEPKTPYHAGSEAGSSTDGSAPQSPGSPAWLDRDKLLGFRSLEQDLRNKRAAEDAAATVAAAAARTKSVHIAEGVRSRGSSGEFERKRKLHYHNEFRPAIRYDSDEDEEEESIIDAAERLSCESRGNSTKRVKDVNGNCEMDKDTDEDGQVEIINGRPGSESPEPDNEG